MILFYLHKFKNLYLSNIFETYLKRRKRYIYISNMIIPKIIYVKPQRII